MKKFLEFMGWKNSRGKWQKDEIVVDLSIALLFITGLTIYYVVEH